MQVPSAELREEQLVASESARGDLARRTRAPRATTTTATTATTATNKVKRVAAVFMQRSGAKPELVAIALVYLVQGLLRLSSLAVFTLFKDELKMDPATVGFLTGVTAFPWLIKPLYGFLSDAVPMWGYRRRSYLILCGALGAASWVTVSLPAVVSAPVVLVALTAGSLSTACADVVADSIVVELSRGKPQSTAGSLQSLCWASVSVGSVVSAYFSGSLVEAYGPRPVFLITACFPLLVAAAATAIPEVPVGRDADETGAQRARAGTSMKMTPTRTPTIAELPAAFAGQAKALWGAMSEKSILYPAIFVFLWQATPSASTAMLFFETNELGFTTEFLGRIQLLASVASLLGVGVYNSLLKDVELKKIFAWTAVLGTGLGMTQLMLITGVNRTLGISDQVFALGDSALLTVLGQVSFMPVLVLAAKLCPTGVEATLFATLMSMLNGGSFLGSAMGSGLTGLFGVTAENFDNLAPLVTTCTLLTLAPLLGLRLLPDNLDSAETVDTFDTADTLDAKRKE